MRRDLGACRGNLKRSKELFVAYVNANGGGSASGDGGGAGVRGSAPVTDNTDERERDSAALAFFSMRGRSPEETARALKQWPWTPSPKVVDEALLRCAVPGGLPYAGDIHREAQRRGVALNETIVGTLLRVCAQNPQLTSSEQVDAVLGGLESVGLKPTEDIVTPVLDIFAKKGTH